MPFKVDHVTLATSSLEQAVEKFSAAGMTPYYGGAHSNGITHMSLLGFTDGSYVELISTLEPGVTAPRWGAHIASDGGPCAWAVEVTDIAAHAVRLKTAGVVVDGPVYVHRKRPDGVLVEWDLAFVGAEGPGALHPFLIEDRTPKHYRVGVADSVADGLLSGVAMVVIAVADVVSATAMFRTVYGLGAPLTVTSSKIPGVIQVFPGEPLALVADPNPDSWISDRVRRYGDSPCAFLLRCGVLEEAAGRYGFGEEDRVGNSDVLWLDDSLPVGVCDADIA